MSIRLQLLIACLGFTILTVGLGLLNSRQQGEMADLALDIYDKVLTGVDNARQAQVDFLHFSAHGGTLDSAGQGALDKLIARLAVTAERAPTPAARALAVAVSDKLVALKTASDPAAAIEEIDAAFTKLVKKYAADGLAFRSRADDLIDAGALNLKIQLGVAGALTIVIGFALQRTVVPPIRRAAQIADAIAAGRLDNVIKARGRSEPAQLLRALDRMQSALAANLTAIETAAEQARRNAADATAHKQGLETLARDFNTAVSGQLRTVAAAATELEATASGLAARADRNTTETGDARRSIAIATDNAQAVAAATSQLSASISDVAHQLERTTTITRQAVGEAQRATGLVGQLAEAVAGVAGVVNFITDIASQTNLLALNATIEAARAGEAGKGFAVVASEVKNLATQTGRATQDITQRIGAMRAVADEVIQIIRAVAGVIGEVDENSGAIAAAATEQGAATEEINRNVTVAAERVGDVGQSIAVVVESTEFTASAATQLLSAASDLARQAEQLRAQVDGFLEAMSRAGDRRRDRRLTLDKMVVWRLVRDPKRTAHSVRLQDLSTGGARLGIAISAQVGDEIAIDGLTAEPLRARIVELTPDATRVQFQLTRETETRVEALLDRLAA